MRRVMFMSLLFGAALAATPLRAETAAPQPAPAGPPAYGEQINLDQARKAAAAAAEEAKKINTFMAIAVVSPSGDLVYFEKMDNTQYASINIAIHKARAAARFRRPTPSFEERVAAGGARPPPLAVGGGIPPPRGKTHTGRGQ